MSVSLNWDRLCIVCEKEGEELSREEATKKRRDTDEVAVLECSKCGQGKLQFQLQYVLQKMYARILAPNK